MRITVALCLTLAASAGAAPAVSDDARSHNIPSPKPSVSEEARRHFMKAVAIQKAAKDGAGLDIAAKEYEAALTLAPSWPEAKYNYALLLEQLGGEAELRRAVALFGEYLKSKPKDARAVQDKVYGLEGKLALVSTTQAKAAARRTDPAGEWMYGAPQDPAHLYTITRGASGYSVLRVNGGNCGLLDVKVEPPKASWVSTIYGDCRRAQSDSWSCILDGAGDKLICSVYNGQLKQTLSTVLTRK